MNSTQPRCEVALCNGLDLGPGWSFVIPDIFCDICDIYPFCRKVLTTGSILQIDEVYNDEDPWSQLSVTSTNKDLEPNVDHIGKPVKDFKSIERYLFNVDDMGFVKKKVLHEGGGLHPNETYTVHIAYSGYLEGRDEPFDMKPPNSPLIVDLNDNGLMPGLQMAVLSMLVGEKAMFLISWEFMYGELGIPPRVPPKTDVLFYIMLKKSIITPQNEQLKYHEPNAFIVIFKEVKMMFASGCALYKAKNFVAAIQLFRRAVNMLHRCRLANEDEQKQQEKMLIKLYMNLAICYNYTKQPQKACTACNELNRLDALWNNGKALYQNGKALVMLGDIPNAKKRLNRALQLSPEKREIKDEIKNLENLERSQSEFKLSLQIDSKENQVTNEFMEQIDHLFTKFKEDCNVTELTLPENLNQSEIAYVKNVCEREQLYFSQVTRGNFMHRKEYLDG